MNELIDTIIDEIREEFPYVDISFCHDNNQLVTRLDKVIGWKTQRCVYEVSILELKSLPEQLIRKRLIAYIKLITQPVIWEDEI